MRLLLALLSLILIAGQLLADQIDLSGDWKFQTDSTDVGLDRKWESPQFDDSSWRIINVPGTWENQGVTQINPDWQQADDLNQPYTGYAWYRRSVEIPAHWQGKFDVFINLGPIDDNDWTYINGKLVGSTTQRHITISGQSRSYKVPPEYIDYGGTNVIAVRVLDFRGLGGITEGPVNLSNQQYAQLGDASDRVTTGGSVIVGKDETVGDAVAVMGSVTVKGHVTGDAVAVMGNVRLYPGAVVDGDAVAVGGAVIKDPGSTVRGETTSVGFNLKGLVWPGSYKHQIPGIGGVWVSRLVEFIAAILFGLVAAVIVALFPSRMDTIAQAISLCPGMSVLYGLGGLLLIIPIVVLLALTCIGIPLIAVEFVAVFFFWLVGKAGISLVLGRKAGQAINNPVSSAILAAAIGAVILAFIDVVPFAGGIVVAALDLIGFGAVLLTRFGSKLDWMPQSDA